MALALLACFLLAIAPIHYTEWLNSSFGELSLRLFAPASHPITAFAHWVSPGRQDADEREEVDREELERTRQAYLRERLENERLRKLVQDLQRGFSLEGSTTVRPLARPVTGNPSDLSGGTLLVRAGKQDGVTLNTVATYDGMQLVGRVERVLPKFCEVRPITARSAGRIDGAVMLDPDGKVMLPCSLTPTGDGVLVGPVTEPDVHETGLELREGQDVRLRVTDGSWPDSSQMLLIGRIVLIDHAPNQPVRREITVQPLVDLRSISQVVLRVPVVEGAHP